MRLFWTPLPPYLPLRWLFSESAMCFLNLQISKKYIPNIFCGDLEIWKTNHTFWIKATFNKVHTYFTFQSRHPNYFGEWMVWYSRIITSIPSIIALWQSSEETMITKVSFQWVKSDRGDCNFFSHKSGVTVNYFKTFCYCFFHWIGEILNY